MTAAARRAGRGAGPGSLDLLDVAILGQVALGYSPFIDRNRTVAATRLSVVSAAPRRDPRRRPAAARGRRRLAGERRHVSLNVVSESLVHDLLQASPTANLMVEVPNFMASDPANVEALHRGCTAPATRCS